VRKIRNITAAEAGRELGRTDRTVRGWLAAGQLLGERVGRDWVVPVTEQVEETEEADATV
jgi:predicted transcriptional regulator